MYALAYVVMTGNINWSAIVAGVYYGMVQYSPVGLPLENIWQYKFLCIPSIPSNIIIYKCHFPNGKGTNYEIRHTLFKTMVILKLLALGPAMILGLGTVETDTVYFWTSLDQIRPLKLINQYKVLSSLCH